MQSQRQALEPTQKQSWDKQIIATILAQSVYQQASGMLLYMAMPQEVNVDELLMAALASGKQVGVPKVNRQTKRMQAVRFLQNDPLVAGVFGILEPRSDAPIMRIDEIDLIIMPGLAFAENGARIGYGGGYYDRFLENESNRPYLLAVAYDWQVFADLPVTPADRKIDSIVTPTRLMEC
jgi:5-formyltetrahydrofolate cyclo-ligase